MQNVIVGYMEIDPKEKLCKRITDFSKTGLKKANGNGKEFLAVYSDGRKEPVEYTEIKKPEMVNNVHSMRIGAADIDEKLNAIMALISDVIESVSIDNQAKKESIKRSIEKIKQEVLQ